jgi:TetR/AcrR family transcriptional regulator
MVRQSLTSVSVSWMRCTLAQHAGRFLITRGVEVTTAAPVRRMGTETSKTRTQLMDAADLLLFEEGYAGVTTRKVAAKAGLKPQLVHYYFRTMDDLFLAVFRRGAEHNLERQARALASPQPLWALWDFNNDRTGTTITMEFTALANRRPAIRAEIANYAEQFRRQQATALAGVFRRYGIDPDEFPPAAVLVLMSSIPRVLVIEDALGVATGHTETVSLVERFLTQLEGPRPVAGEGEN